MPWIYAIVGLLVGTIVGVVISRLTTPEYKKQKSVQKELEAAKFELEQQRQELVDHFAQTAEMLDTLGKDYTKLYNIWPRPLLSFCQTYQNKTTRLIRKTAMSSETIAEDQPEFNEQPKDYANGATGLLKDQEKEIINAPEAVTAKAS